MLENICSMRIVELSLMGLEKEIPETYFAIENIDQLPENTENKQEMYDSAHEYLHHLISQFAEIKEAALNDFNEHMNNLLNDLSNLNKNIVPEELEGMTPFEAKEVINRELMHVKSHIDTIQEQNI